MPEKYYRIIYTKTVENLISWKMQPIFGCNNLFLKNKKDRSKKRFRNDITLLLF